ncbi:MAG: hypothetical protein ACRENE_29380 [Polyangiaceae bacterium]
MTSRPLVSTVRLRHALGSTFSAIAVFVGASASLAPLVVAGAASTLVACDDENDPKTWVKRLDDPAQQANAIKRLTQFYEDGMTKASNNASDPAIVALLGTIIEPMTKTYTAGSLDDKTRVDLMKFLAETHDPRTQPALAKALKSFEMGKTDDEIRVTCESINAMAKGGTKLDQSVLDGLWDVFAKFQLSKTTSQRLFQAIHEAIVNVHEKSYGDKAILKLKAPVTDSVDSQKDQMMWWQLTSVQVISDLQYAPAIKPLIVALLTPAKTASLGPTIQFALLKMAPAAEPELIKALNGSDPDYVAAAAGSEDKVNLGVVANVLAQLGRPAGRDAILAALATTGDDTDTSRTELAQALVQMPKDPRCEPAFLAVYNKLTWDSSDKMLGPLKPRAALAQQSASFYDPTMVDWLIKEMKKAPDFQARLLQIEPAIKLMTPDKKDDVAAALAALKKEAPADIFAYTQQMFDGASASLTKCKMDANCYVSLFSDNIPNSPPTANYKAIKAAWMAVIYGSGNAAGTRSSLLKYVDKVQNAGARIALVAAIDELSPTGDVATADALDKIVAGDTKSGNKDLAATDNTLAQVAWRLRNRSK